MTERAPPASLELTHVLYDSESHVSLALALVTLSPILLMASYAALAVMTRELIIIEMWAGQLACEGFNWVLKRAIKQERPVDSHGNGYGFPSSHSQYMGYFASFLVMHLFFRHRFPSTGYRILDRLRSAIIYAVLISWAGAVCYSRFHLTYHTRAQILWGVSVGVCFGTFTYVAAELIPARRPGSLLGRLRTALLSTEICSWLRLRDGWAVWDDGGREAEWIAWRARWDQQRVVRKDE